MNKLILFVIFSFSASVLASHKDSSGLLVAQISVWGASGDILIQTNPKHSIEGLSCESDYWLKLRKTDEGSQALLSMLMAAQLANKTVLVRAVDDAGTDFCRLERVISYQ